MTARTFVDTNVWVYAVDSDEPAKGELARAVIAGATASALVVSAHVLGEFYVVATRTLARPVPPAEARRLVERMAQLTVVPVDARLVEAAMTGSAAWQVSYWDALIIAAAASSGCDRVLSEDLSDGATYGSVRVENPFRTRR